MTRLFFSVGGNYIRVGTVVTGTQNGGFKDKITTFGSNGWQ